MVELVEDPDPTVSTAETLKNLFIQKYPTKMVEPTTTNFDSEISDLAQDEDEALLAYYRRTLSLLSRIGCRDRPKKVTLMVMELTSLESAMLDTVLRAFVKGLRDGDIRRDALRGLVSQDRSLHAIYSLAEEFKATTTTMATIPDSAPGSPASSSAASLPLTEDTTLAVATSR